MPGTSFLIQMDNIGHYARVRATGLVDICHARSGARRWHWKLGAIFVFDTMLHFISLLQSRCSSQELNRPVSRCNLCCFVFTELNSVSDFCLLFLSVIVRRCSCSVDRTLKSSYELSSWFLFCCCLFFSWPSLFSLRLCLLYC